MVGKGDYPEELMMERDQALDFQGGSNPGVKESGSWPTARSLEACRGAMTVENLELDGSLKAP